MYRVRRRNGGDEEGRGWIYVGEMEARLYVMDIHSERMGGERSLTAERSQDDAANGGKRAIQARRARERERGLLANRITDQTRLVY